MVHNKDGECFTGNIARKKGAEMLTIGKRYFIQTKYGVDAPWMVSVVSLNETGTAAMVREPAHEVVVQEVWVDEFVWTEAN